MEETLSKALSLEKPPFVQGVPQGEARATDLANERGVVDGRKWLLWEGRRR